MPLSIDLQTRRSSSTKAKHRRAQMSTIYNAVTQLIVTLCLLSQTPFASGLLTDREQPINILSDNALRSEKKNITIYSGNVVVTQGSLKITADILSLLNSASKVEKIIATGQPATYQQRPEAGKELVEARGKVIEYHVLDERLHIVGNAFIRQQGSTVNGDKIDYFIEQQLVNAKGNLEQKDKRVNVIWEPAQADTSSIDRGDIDLSDTDPNNTEQDRDTPTASEPTVDSATTRTEQTP